MLSDFGERRILHEIIEVFFPQVPNALVPIGDDGAVLSFGNADEAIVLTTDPCPVPVAWLLGNNDYYLFGWYSILINASDLAAMGAKPLGVLLAVEAREDMSIENFKRFLQGAADAALEFSCPVIGGNLKDSDTFSCVGTAVGLIHKDDILRRSGAQDGDLVVVIGEMGVFASGVLSKMHNITLSRPQLERVEQNLLFPKARVREGQVLAKKHIANSAMDSSDGLANCFYELAHKSGLDIFLDFNDICVDPVVHNVANCLRIDYRKLLLMWGDWQLVCTVPEHKIAQLVSELENLGTEFSIVGKTKRGKGNVFLMESESYQKLYKMDNERFSKSSYFTQDLKQVFDLSRLPLFEQPT